MQSSGDAGAGSEQSGTTCSRVDAEDDNEGGRIEYESSSESSYTDLDAVVIDSSLGFRCSLCDRKVEQERLEQIV